MIVNANLSASQIDSLLGMLRLHRKAIGYTIDGLKEIYPSVCMHCVLMEDDHKLSIELQRRLNSNLKKVVKRKILKLLKVNIIYPVFDSRWISPIHLVPKKGEMIVMNNENNELIATMAVMGWRMSIDYRKLN